MDYREGPVARSFSRHTAASAGRSVGGTSNMRTSSATRIRSSSEEANARGGASEITAQLSDPCVCGPDFYTNVLGPTADETILLGIQTILEYCRKCPSPFGVEEPAPRIEEEPLQIESNDEVIQEEEEDIGSAEDLTHEIEREEARNCYETGVACEKARNCYETGVSCMPEAASALIGEESLLMKRSLELQTMNFSPINSMESQTEQPEMRHDDSQTGRMQESDSSQTSAFNIKNSISQTRQLSVRSRMSQSRFYKSTPSQVFGSTCKSAKCQSRNPHVNIQPHMSKSILKDSSSSRSKGSSGSCTCPETSDELNCCQCHSPEMNTTDCSCSSCKLKATQKTIKRSCLKNTTRCKCYNTNATGGSSRVTYPCCCGAKRHAKVCSCVNSTSGYEACNCIDMSNSVSQMGDTNEAKVRYAITKITKFYSYTTFEVMRSTSKKPKVMPKSLEGVFVMKNCVRS